MDDAVLLLVEREWAGQCSPEERECLARWIGGDPARQSEVDSYRRMMTRAREARPLDGQSILDGVRRRIAQEQGARPRVDPPRITPHPIGARSPWWLAAAAALVAGLGVATWHAMTSRSAPQAFGEFVTGAGSRSTVVLRDGTRLVLAPATRIRVPADFGVRTRTIDLDGEAYFAVSHDSQCPFAVRTATSLTRDVGTAFVVRAYADDEHSLVAVQEGEVALATARVPKASTVLAAGAVGVIDTAGRITVRRGVHLSGYFGWTQGNLVFESTPLRDVARDLARTFDLQVTVADEALGNELITASFTDQPVDAILNEVTTIVGAQYDRSGRSVTIRRKPRSTIQPGPHHAPQTSVALDSPVHS